MKKVVYIAIAIVIVSVAAYLTYGSQTKITNYPSSGTDILAFGDSLVLGVGSVRGGGFVKMLSEDLNISIINLGVSGDTTKSALSRLGQISKYKPKVVILLLGGNDFLNSVPEEDIFNNLDRIIETIHQTGGIVLLVGLEDKTSGKKYGEFFEKLVEKRGTAYVPDILGGIFGRPELMFDNLHPNDKGYRLMADRIKPILLPLFDNMLQ